MKKQSELYRGKSKTLYYTENPNFLVIEFRDDISAQNGLRIESLKRKGMINNKFNYFIMKKLQENGFATHIEKLLSDNDLLVKKLDMIPIECVIRNRAAGSLVKRINVKEGTLLNPPLFDLFLKDDDKHDPIINESYCETFGWISKKKLIQMRELTYTINDFLISFFNEVNLILIDFKLEFGLLNQQLVLGDEFSLDVARIWDKITMNKMDKDLFRQNLGNIITTYEEVAYRLGINFN